MKRTLIQALSFVLLLLISSCKKEKTVTTSLYFPPTGSAEWESADPGSLGWNTAALTDLYTFLDTSNTKAFIVLKNGRIVLEKYFGKQLDGSPFTSSSYWYWASAGKTMTAFLTGIAQQQGYLSISDYTSRFLGNGWSSLTTAQEGRITIHNQLTMTTGLDDGVTDNHCTDPSCLQYLAEPGTRWAYHNAPYTLLDKVIENSTGQSFTTYFNAQLRDKTGMDGFWTYVDYDHVYYSTARSFARFGLLLLNQGIWDKTPVLSDKEYFDDMTNTSQALNQSYGYLTWLNGKGSYMVPGYQIIIPFDLTPNAPGDMFAAMGKNGQIINVVPSEELVVVRMGDTPDGTFVPMTFQNNIWKYLSAVVK
jgi:CubicO group peptidase (beta-lactamase class C family)